MLEGMGRGILFGVTNVLSKGQIYITGLLSHVSVELLDSVATVAQK